MSGCWICCKNQDIYIEAATEIYGVKRDEIADWSEEKGKWIIKKEHGDKRDMGKRTGLGLQYRMGHEAFVENAKKDGVTLDPDFAQVVVQAWRKQNPIVVECWDRIMRAVFHALDSGKRGEWNGIKFQVVGQYLCARLPSGRVLRYFKPKRGLNKWGGEQLEYVDGSKKGLDGNPYRQTHGGRLLENIVQAISRDLLVYSMYLIQKAGYNVCFHVHDESVTEVFDHEVKVAKDVCHAAMETLPVWAEGLPLTAETHIAKRYTK